MNDGIARRTRVKELLGKLLALPTFAINVDVMRETTLHSRVEQIVATVFLHRLREVIRATSRRREATSILEALNVFMNGNKNSTNSSMRISNPTLVSEHRRRFENCSKEVLRILLNDFAEILQISPGDEASFDNMCVEGRFLLQKLHVTAESGSFFMLMSSGVMASIVCAGVICRREGFHQTHPIQLSTLPTWVENILRVWLCCFDAAGVSFKTSNEKVGSLTVDVKRWVGYMVSCKTVFDALLQCVGPAPFGDKIEYKKDAPTTLCFVGEFYASSTVFSSLREACGYVLNDVYNSTPHRCEHGLVVERMLDFSDQIKSQFIAVSELPNETKGHDIFPSLFHFFREEVYAPDQ